ncbi:MAG: hypothetical protein Q9226_003479 [Calogaya cf. arnoldii]
MNTEPSYAWETWIWQGKVVLDFNGRPMQDIHALPATISSREQGCYLESMFREDPRITYHEILSRMPVTHHKPAVTGHSISQRRYYFRLQAGCIDWVPSERNREQTTFKDFSEQMEKILPPSCLVANSTEGFRDLTEAEIQQIKSGRKQAKSKREDSSHASPSIGGISAAKAPGGKSSAGSFFPRDKDGNQGVPLHEPPDHTKNDGASQAVDVPSVPQGVASGLCGPDRQSMIPRAAQLTTQSRNKTIPDTSSDTVEHNGRSESTDWERDSRQWDGDDEENENMYFEQFFAEPDESLFAHWPLTLYEYERS